MSKLHENIEAILTAVTALQTQVATLTAAHSDTSTNVSNNTATIAAIADSVVIADAAPAVNTPPVQLTQG